MTSERSTVALPQGTLSYLDAGTGEPVVFVHGLVVNADHWRAVVSELSDSCRCLVPDLPLGSHTRPMAPDADLSPSGVADLLVDFLDALGVESATVVGNDTGGAFCQVLLARHPRVVGRLVLTPSDAFDRFLPWPYRLLQWGARLPALVSGGAQLLRLPGVRRLAYAPLTATGIPDEKLARYTAPLRQDPRIRRDLRRVLLGIDPAVTGRAARSFPDFERPVLVVWGRSDPIFPFADARRLVDLFPDARLVELSGTRGFVPEDRPAALGDHLRAFVG